MRLKEKYKMYKAQDKHKTKAIFIIYVRQNVWHNIRQNI